MIDDLDIKAEGLLDQLEEAKTKNKIEKKKPTYIKKKSKLDKLNLFMKNKVYGETDLLK
jgi:hypothetical protein